MRSEIEQPMQPATTVACDLTREAFGERVQEWRALAKAALRRTEAPGRIVTDYPSNVRGRLETLIEAERECCPFLEFDIRERADVIEVEVRFPPDFEAVVSSVIEPSEVGGPAR